MELRVEFRLRYLRNGTYESGALGSVRRLAIWRRSMSRSSLSGRSHPLVFVTAAALLALVLSLQPA